jgi:hypothetical protein
MSGAHTPGPWDFGPGYEPGKSTFDLYGPGGRQVIACASYENMWLAAYDPVTDTANARLIAAAPELLEALISTRDAMTSPAALAVMDAAISKATATRNSGDEG